MYVKATVWLKMQSTTEAGSVQQEKKRLRDDVDCSEGPVQPDTSGVELRFASRSKVCMLYLLLCTVTFMGRVASRI